VVVVVKGMNVMLHHVDMLPVDLMWLLLTISILFFNFSVANIRVYADLQLAKNRKFYVFGSNKLMPL